MEDVSGVFMDENRPPVPIRRNASNISRDDAIPGKSGGYTCQSSFDCDIFIR